jgi:hypothetical protein
MRRLARLGEGTEGWLAPTNGVIGDGRALYWVAVEADLEGIVAKRLADPYRANFTRWQKIVNPDDSQRRGRAEWFRERRALAGNR